MRHAEYKSAKPNGYSAGFHRMPNPSSDLTVPVGDRPNVIGGRSDKRRASRFSAAVD
jgi:hypothetical protein